MTFLTPDQGFTPRTESLPRLEVALSPLAGIVVTDTVPLRDGAPDLITQLTCADILEDTIRRIFVDDSVSEIFAGENQLF